MTEQTVGADRLVGLEIGGKYKIVSLLGEGGMGCVYKGEQKLGNTIRKVAIKTLHEHLSHDPQILARFEREVGTVAGLQHPNTIQVFDFGKMDDGTLYIVMEFVEGKSVAGWLETTGAMEPARVVNILKQVCGSLEEAHGLGIVHRDLKPDNVVLCDKAGQHDWVEVLDFGIAKRSNETDEKEHKLTQQGMVLGTPPYMSPEQFTGKPVDRRSDIYSLAVMAYEMLTGGLPFNGNTAWEWATAHMTAQPRPLETFPVSGRIPPAMKAAILRGLEKDPLRRPQTVTEFYNMFSTGAGAPTDYSLVPGGMATPPPTTNQPQAQMYGQGQTQPGTPVTSPQAGTPMPTPVPGYQTGQVYMTPPQGAHTYTPQPFPQMHTPPPQEKKGGGGLAIVAVLLALLILVGGGVGFAYSQGYIGKTAQTAPTDTSKVGSTAPETVTAVTVTPNPTDTGPIEALVDAGKPNTNSFVGQPTVHKDAGAVAVNTAPTFTAPTTYTPTYTPTYTTPTYTAPPTFTAPPGQQPAECRAARIMKEQGRDQQAAQLALRCMRKGGSPPF
jgi:serine/threonine-protein kinase